MLGQCEARWLQNSSPESEGRRKTWGFLAPRTPPTIVLPAHFFSPSPPNDNPALGGLSASDLLAFVDAGRSLILAVPVGPAGPGRAVAAGLGVDPEPAGAEVVDAVHNAGGDAAAVLGVVSGPPIITGGAPTTGPPGRPPRPAVLHGAGFTVSPSASGVWPLVVAPTTAFSTAASTSPAVPAAAGAALLLAAAVQTRSNGRALVVGSEDLFDSELGAPGLAVSPSGGGPAAAPCNGALAAAAAAWVLGGAGVLRASPLRHRLAPGTASALAGPGRESGPHRSGDAPYRVSDSIQVALDIEQKVLEKGGRSGGGGVVEKWVPFSGTDVQVEYTMLDPHVRKTLSPPTPGAQASDDGFTGNATFAAVLDAPDVYGAFKLTLTYRRPGWSFLASETPAPLRPFRHDEFPRFLPAAYPYYTAAAATMVAFFGVTLVGLYSGV